MYNEIHLLFWWESTLNLEYIFDVNTNLCILPYPNSMSITQQNIFVSHTFHLTVQNINPSHFLVTQIEKELKEDFGIVLMKADFSPENSILEQFLAPEQEKEGYTIFVREKCISLKSASLHGLFNAFQSFRQILISSPKFNFDGESEAVEGWVIPELDLLDWPCLEIRGVSDNISHGQILTVESAKNFIRDISRFKMNHCAFYFEDKFQCSKHPQIGKGNGAFSPEELIEIDNYAKSRFVNFFPIFETLGHHDNILSIPEYNSMGEFPGSQSLSIANGNIYPFLRDIIEELVPCFSSKYFHIGLDDTYDMGHGNSEELINAIGMDGALRDHIRKIESILHDNGNKKIIIYHDTVIKYPKLLSALSKDIIIMVKDNSPHPKKSLVQEILKLGFQVVVCPSVLGCCQHFPAFRASAQNILSWAAFIKKIKLSGTELILGQVTCTWGDFSNHNFRENNMYGLILAATVSWTKGKVELESFIQHMGKLFYGLLNVENQIHFQELFFGLVDLSKFYSKGFPRSRQRFFDNLYRNPFRDTKQNVKRKDLSHLVLEIEKMHTLISQILPKIQRNSSYFQYLVYSVNLVKLLGEKYKLKHFINNSLNPFKKQFAPPSPSTLALWTGKIEEFKIQTHILIAEYEKLCLLMAKRPNFDYPLNRFKALVSYSDKKINQLQERILNVSPNLPSAYIWYRPFKRSSLSRYFRKKIILKGKITQAKIQIMAGNFAMFFVNGEIIGQIQSRFSSSIFILNRSIQVFDIASYLHTGENIIAFEVSHYLGLTGYLNYYAEIECQSEQNKLSVVQISSDSTCQASLGPYKDWGWCEGSVQVLSMPWGSAYVRGYSPRINGYLNGPDLLAGEQSFPEDRFGFSSELYFFLQYKCGKNLARILHWFLKLIL